MQGRGKPVDLNININISNEAGRVIDTLEANGFEAYAVGGCVRDSVMGKVPEDWDICTSALPEQTAGCFPESHIIETGLKHGTITVITNSIPVEVTTYRIDGDYSDNRHPDSVRFVRELEGDLSRRDFTINAMAYNHGRGLIDFFGGVSDIERKIIRCVGEADKRFREDSLRIMRALRFASALGFTIDEETSGAILRNKELLGNIAVERISVELNKMLVGENVKDILLFYTQIIEKIIPEITDMIGFKQNNPHHIYDVWRHTVESITMIPADHVLRLTMLLHDIAKPGCYTETDSVGHFHGHQQPGSDMAGDILRRLKYPNSTIDTVKKLVLYHDAVILPDARHIKRRLSRLGENGLRLLLMVKRADIMAQSEFLRKEKLESLDKVKLVLDEIIRQRQCFSMKDLAVGGRDLIDAGIPEGAEVGSCLNRLLKLVIDESVENRKEDLLEILKTF